MYQELAAQLPPKTTQPRGEPPQSYLLRTYTYFPNTGELTFRGTKHRPPFQYGRNVLQMKIGSRRYSVHRIIYKMLVGEEAPRGRNKDIRGSVPAKEADENGRDYVDRLVAANRASNFPSIQKYLIDSYDPDFDPAMIDVVRDADTFMLNYDVDFAPELNLPSRKIKAEAFKAKALEAVKFAPPGTKPVTQSNEHVATWKRAAEAFGKIEKLHGLHPLSLDFIAEMPEGEKHRLLNLLSCRQQLEQWRTDELPVPYTEGNLISANHADVMLVQFAKTRIDRAISELTNRLLDEYQSFDLPEPTVAPETPNPEDQYLSPTPSHDPDWSELEAEASKAAPTPSQHEAETDAEHEARLEALSGPESTWGPQQNSSEPDRFEGDEDDPDDLFSSLVAEAERAYGDGDEPVDLSVLDDDDDVTQE